MSNQPAPTSSAPPAAGAGGASSAAAVTADLPPAAAGSAGPAGPYLLGVATLAGALGAFWLLASLTGAAAAGSLRSVTMTANMALALVLAAASLALLAPEGSRGLRQGAGVLAALVVAALGALSGVEHLAGVDLGVDQVLAVEPPGALGVVSPNRMGPPGAVCLVLLGGGLLAVAGRRRALGASLGLATAVVSLVPAVGYLYGIPAWHGRPRLTGIAWPTVVGLLALGVGLVLAHARGGFVGLLRRQDAGGMLLRQLLPAVIGVPVVLGLVVVHGERLELYDTATGTGVLVLALSLIFSGVAWSGAVRVSRAVARQARADAARRESEERLRLFVEHAPAAVAMFDRDMRYLAVSRRYLADYGVTLPDVLGQSHYQVFPDLPARWREVHSRCLAGAVERCEEDPFPRARGGVDWVRWEIHPWHTAAGHLGGIMLFSEVITGRKLAADALRRERDFSSTVVDTAGALVVVTDRDGRITRFNRACETTTGRSAAEVVGHPVADLVPPEEREDFIRSQHALVAGGRPRSGEGAWLAKDGSRRRIAWSHTILADPEGVVEHVIGTGVDVTERSQAETALRLANTRLEEGDRHKNEFLAMLSHELRNPLSAIRNSAFLLAHVPQGGDQATRALSVLDRQALQLTRLVDDLLDLTRISRGKVTLQRQALDLDALARSTAEDHRELFTRNGVDLVVRGAGRPLTVNGDPTRLAQAIGNLLNNAAKFTPRGGHTVLSVERGPGGQACVRVQDNGVGIPAETRAHLFEPFVQADRTLERSRGGLGLGLALVKGLVEMQGGQVSAQSAGAGQGAEFTLRFPLLDAAPEASAPVPAAPATRLRVVVVEDNVDAAESLREVLELEDHQVAVGYTGPEGVELVRRFKPDVVLCDIGLPGLDGYGVARALRVDPALEHTLLVALSGYALPEDVQRAKQAGFDRHLAKPPDLDALTRLLAEAHAHPAPS